MSDIKLKARVVLTDDEGRHLGECEIISDSEEIFYNNATPMPNAVGDLPAGTTFNKYSNKTYWRSHRSIYYIFSGLLWIV